MSMYYIRSNFLLHQKPKNDWNPLLLKTFLFFFCFLVVFVFLVFVFFGCLVFFGFGYILVVHIIYI